MYFVTLSLYLKKSYRDMLHSKMHVIKNHFLLTKNNSVLAEHFIKLSNLLCSVFFLELIYYMI